MAQDKAGDLGQFSFEGFERFGHVSLRGVADLGRAVRTAEAQERKTHQET